MVSRLMTWYSHNGEEGEFGIVDSTRDEVISTTVG